VRPARALIVDDSVVIRRSLAEVLVREPEVKSAEGAANGQIAVRKMSALRPDVVLLDIDIPDSDALATLAAIREASPDTPVIMLSTANSAAATVDALAQGAKDYVNKPEAATINDSTLAQLSREVAAKIGLHCSHLIRKPPPSASLVQASRLASVPVAGEPRHARRIDIVVVGISTGGPSALMELLPKLPEDFPVPILIVQHMPPMFTRLLGDRLNAKSKILVAEARPSTNLKAGAALIAPGDFHMSVLRDGDKIQLRTHQGLPEHSCRPSVDVLFRSVAQAYGPNVLAVVMTGMGRDGFAGCQDIQAAGGQVIVQDEASSVVWGMPGVIVRANLADSVVPLADLAAEIIDRAFAFRDRRPSTVVATGS
jgi:two-component system, chemotaxis family, protein-glutamate methylesterase/glutaminase